MLCVCIPLECISQILEANNFVFYIVYCIWTAGRICIFADRGGGGRGLLVDVGTSLYPLEGQDVLLLLSNVYLHVPMVLQINSFDIQAYLQHEDVKKVNFGAALCALCYIITHSSNSTLRVFLDPSESLLQISYQQNMITALF